jgi:hypothetical protein
MKIDMARKQLAVCPFMPKKSSSSSNSFPPLKECYHITFKRATPNETISTPHKEQNSKGQNMKRRTINVYMGGASRQLTRIFTHLKPIWRES